MEQTIRRLRELRERIDQLLLETEKRAEIIGKEIQKNTASFMLAQIEGGINGA